jgi:hypothetical protein
MLGLRTDQRGLFEADHLYLTFYSKLTIDLCANKSALNI